MIKDICISLQEKSIIKSSQIFQEFELLNDHPWAETARSSETNYYECLYGVVQQESPTKILEIGTAFGMSAASMLKACKTVNLFITLDLGIYAKQLGANFNNIDFARVHIHNWCQNNNIPIEKVRFYCTNTQPFGKGDNENIGVEVLHWSQNSELVRLLEYNYFDIIFVDGKHTEDGLFNDLQTFWKFLRPGGLIICDDLHDPSSTHFLWSGHTLQSYNRFLSKYEKEVEDSYIWNYPKVKSYDSAGGLRPFGLIRKKKMEQVSYKTEFEMFDSLTAQSINQARLDHLASLGLDIFNKSVLEVGAGVGWHTSFFEKLGCDVLSTDGRQENVIEHRRRYPYRRVEVADLSIAGSHNNFSMFDIIYCYGTLYHLSNPSLCIKELSNLCRELFLIESCVSPEETGDINLVQENSSNPNQSKEGRGCRPRRKWVLLELKKYFSYVYISISQPNHPDFPLSWPASISPPHIKNARAIFVASRKQLNLSTLSPELLYTQEQLKPVFDEENS